MSNSSCEPNSAHPRQTSNSSWKLNNPHPREMTNSSCKRVLVRTIPIATTSARNFRWLFFAQVLAVTTMAAAAEAKMSNREIDGFVDSAQYGYKAIFRRWMRESPGRYWMAYVGFVAGVMIMLFNRASVLYLLFPSGYRYMASSSYRGRLLGMQSVILTVCLMYVAIVGDTVADLMVTYLVGLCQTQILIDTIRVNIIKPHDDKMLFYFALAPFAATSILAVVLQDSFGPLNRLNVAYFVVHGFIIHFALRNAHFERIEASTMVAGTLASAAQMGFCCAAFYIARQVEAVPDQVIGAFLYTTAATSGMTHASLFFLLPKPEWFYDAILGGVLILLVTFIR